MRPRWLTLLLPSLVLLLPGLAGPALPAALSGTFIVNSTSDVSDGNIGDGLCETVGGNGICTLRAAVQEVSANPNPDTINVPAGTYMLTMVGAGDSQLNDDLDITGTVTIIGAGPNSTIIDGNGILTADRVLDVYSGVVTIAGVSIRNGRSSGPGGGITNRAQATLTLSNTTVMSNTAASGGAFGGGIYNLGRLTLTHSTVSSNTTGATSPVGAGIAHIGVELIVIDSTISGNTTTGLGGGIYSSSSALALVNSTLSGNISTISGGGILEQGGNTSLYNATVTDNYADSDTGGGGVAQLAGTLNFIDSIIAANYETEPFGGGGVIVVEGDCSGTIVSQGNNIVYDHDNGNCTIIGAFTQAYPLFGPLANNGGPTLTHALLPGSPGIDAGDAVSCNDWAGTPLTRAVPHDRLSAA